jgi:hypothetical protein
MEANDGNFKLSITPDLNQTIMFFKPVPMNITFTSPITGKKIGVFSELDGKLNFSGDLDESGKIFVDFVCNSFNKRIQDMIQEAQGDNNDSV